MILHILRAFFILLMAAVGLSFVYDDSRAVGGASIDAWILPAASISMGVLLLCIDILSPRRKLAIFAGTFFGLVARDVQMRLLLGDPMKLTEAEIVGDAAEATRQFLALYGGDEE